MREIRESGEDYLEVILEILDELGTVRSIEVSRRMGVSRASVSKAVTVLREAGLVEPSYYGDIVLTEAGLERAKDVKHRHMLIFSFLTQELGVSEENARQDACRMEHIVSRELLDKIAARMEAREE